MTRAHLSLALVSLSSLSCGAEPGPVRPAPHAVAIAPIGSATSAATTPAPRNAPTTLAEDDSPVPITPRDAAWGSRTAPVTLVVFGDYECPFTHRYHETLTRLRTSYGPDAIRLVWKHNPLPFHTNARSAAVASQAVLAAGGNEAFWRFHEVAFRERRSLSGPAYEAFAEIAGVDIAAFRAALASREPAQKVDADMDLAKSVGAFGTPASFVNGRVLSGAQAYEVVSAMVDEETEKARAARAEGLAPERTYVAMSKINFVAKKERDPIAQGDRDDDPAPSYFAVPVGRSPTRGDASAPVTMVVFSEFQCPFCKRAVATVEQIERTYGKKVRLVWRNQPLAFHPRAVPAANFALAARAQGGEKAFWAAHDELFHRAPRLDDSELDEIAKRLKLDVAKTRRAVQKGEHDAVIKEDQTLAESVKAQGTPTFFINGQKLVGAQPFEKFKAVIDEELAHAEGLITRGTSPGKVYDEIMKSIRGGTRQHPILGAGIQAAPAGLALKVVDVRVGTGATLKKGDRMSVHYVGTLSDGSEFDSSRKLGHAFSAAIGVGHVIKGWDDGLIGMKVGGIRKLTIPPALGYGDRGAPPKIPPKSTLTFEIELLSIP